MTEVNGETGVFLIKSGTDFEEFNDFEVFLDVSEEEFKSVKSEDSNKLITHLYSKQKKIMVRVEKVPITNEISKNPGIEKHIKSVTQGFNEKMNQMCGYFDVDIEGRFAKMRYEETNCANMFSDLIRTEFEDADLAILNSGTLRSNAVIPSGDVTLRMIQDMLPMADKIVKLRVPGDIILSLLENSVSQWPTLDGRFAALSGLHYSFDPEYPAGSRVHSVTNLDGKLMDMSREAKYIIVAKYFIA